MQIAGVKLLLVAAFIGAVGYGTASAPPADPALSAAVASPARPPAAVARDKARHPVEELTFFGINPKMTVIELWPGGGYWTDILGPYLAPSGHYTVALPPTGGEENAGVQRFRTRIAAGEAKLCALQQISLA